MRRTCLSVAEARVFRTPRASLKENEVEVSIWTQPPYGVGGSVSELMMRSSFIANELRGVLVRIVTPSSKQAG